MSEAAVQDLNVIKMDLMHSLGHLMVLHNSTSYGRTIAAPPQSPAAALLTVDHRQDPHRLKITVLDYTSVVDLIISKSKVP